MNGSIIAFNSVNYAILLEKILKEKNIKCRIIPTPRSIDINCGVSIMYDEYDENLIRKVIDENNIIIKDFFKIY